MAKALSPGGGGVDSCGVLRDGRAGVVDVRARAGKVYADADAYGHGGGYGCADQNYRTDRHAHADPDGSRDQVADLYAIADFHAIAHTGS